ncbi:DUF6302 family protein [Streptomyces sp. NPDC057654]|uniref:DUF6302 family protein n=1 Tax=Streptomyces sp. NPDC057654 TaxID=3346196 RepID=UPI003676E1DD
MTPMMRAAVREAEVCEPLPRGLTVSLLPAEEAYDYEHYQDRLADPALLTGAVAVRVFRAPLLAVPVGGSRRGGCMSFGELSLAIAARSLLADRAGFPDLRLRWSTGLAARHVVGWGEPAPPWWEDPAVIGRFYGYSQDAMDAFVQPHPAPVSPAFSGSRRPTILNATRGVWARDSPPFAE